MRQCKICGKGSMMATTRILLRGHYNPTKRSRKYPNLQKTKLQSGERTLACTKCIRSLGNGKSLAKLSAKGGSATGGKK